MNSIVAALVAGSMAIKPFCN